MDQNVDIPFVLRVHAEMNQPPTSEGIRSSLHSSVFVSHCQVRDIAHTNLNPYIGVCATSPNVCIISHFCYRGSIEVRLW